MASLPGRASNVLHCTPADDVWQKTVTSVAAIVFALDRWCWAFCAAFGAPAKTFLEWASDNAAEFQNKQEIAVRVD